MTASPPPPAPRLEGGATDVRAAYTLVVSGPDVAVERRLARGARLVVGRDATCDLRVAHASVSRRHAVVEFGAGLVLTDLGSTNGTRVAGDSVRAGAPIELLPDVEVELGALRLVVRRDGERARPSAASRPDGVVSETLVALAEAIDREIAPNAPFVVAGERGVGRATLAELVHARSRRGAGPFVRFACGDRASGQVDRALFGEGGALARARGGTLYLDALDELSLRAQGELARLLRVATAARAGDVRVVASTERDPADEVARGTLRRDLLDAVGARVFTIAPLRARPAEIGPLSAAFVAAAARSAGRAAPPTLAPDACARLVAHDWPGNVGELARVLARAVATTDGATIDAAGLGLPEPTAPSGASRRSSRPAPDASVTRP